MHHSLSLQRFQSFSFRFNCNSLRHREGKKSALCWLRYKIQEAKSSKNNKWIISLSHPFHGQHIHQVEIWTPNVDYFRRYWSKKTSISLGHFYKPVCKLDYFIIRILCNRANEITIIYFIWHIKVPWRI